MANNETVLLSDKCRLCLNKAGIHNVFESKALLETIEEILFVKLICEKRLPQRICEFCLQTVTSAKELKVTANINDANLKCLFPLDEKLEPGKPRIFVRTDLIKEPTSKTTASEESNKKLPSLSPLKKIKLNGDNKESRDSKNNDKNENDDEYICGTCQKVFRKWKKFYLHQRTHIKAVTCPNEGCGKKFATKGDLERHYRTHTGEKPYRCEICGIGFAQLASLKMHSTRVHQLPADNKDTSISSSSTGLKTLQAKSTRILNVDDSVNSSETPQSTSTTFTTETTTHSVTTHFEKK